MTLSGLWMSRKDGPLASEMASEKACDGNMWEKTEKAPYSREIGFTILAIRGDPFITFASRGVQNLPKIVNGSTDRLREMQIKG